MQTADLIQLLELTPNLQLKLEYLPASFVQSGSKIQSVLSVSKENTISKEGKETHLVITENKTDMVIRNLFTKDVLKLLEESSVDPNSVVKIKYGNESFKTALLDISEIEVFDKAMTFKLFFTNNPATSQQEKVEKQKKKENPITIFHYSKN
ncbi:hypothetical protein QWY93_16720 [Echinicola jeungdonensis]|uniref:Uncharacterized protein n=1 Tax=Echinicola jeungdonensis TaxID=709343 RepID=A0ABV5J6R0_9BACT|nr:hypothetical protein [Echinicola jeungdonensis]MDN3670961.1 hypothetical protein [Echinicola jeungdonensis]